MGTYPCDQGANCVVYPTKGRPNSVQTVAGQTKADAGSCKKCQVDGRGGAPNLLVAGHNEQYRATLLQRADMREGREVSRVVKARYDQSTVSSAAQAAFMKEKRADWHAGLDVGAELTSALEMSVKKSAAQAAFKKEKRADWHAGLDVGTALTLVLEKEVKKNAASNAINNAINNAAVAAERINRQREAHNALGIGLCMTSDEVRVKAKEYLATTFIDDPYGARISLEVCRASRLGLALWLLKVACQTLT